LSANCLIDYIVNMHTECNQVQEHNHQLKPADENKFYINDKLDKSVAGHRDFSINQSPLRQ